MSAASAAVLLLAVQFCSGFPTMEDQLAVADEIKEVVASPLEQLLATAAGQPILPLAPNHLRSKRKPQRTFNSLEGRPRFKPRNRVEAVEEVETEAPTTVAAPVRRFTGFPGRRNNFKRPRPTSAILPTLAPAVVAADEPTVDVDPALPDLIPREEQVVESVTPEPAAQQQIHLEDFFGTPQPKVLSLPAVSNDIAEEVRARTIAITGAQPVGVSRDISPRRESSRQIQLIPESAPIEESEPLPPRREVKKKGSRRPLPPSSRIQPQDDVQDFEDRQLPPSGGRAGGVRGRTVSREHVGTVERYKIENEDGSITWGYENEDGSYKEETIGADCITRGKYGYIDPTGEVREYSYTSGVRCDPETRQLNEQPESNSRGANGHGYYDYARNKFVMADGRRVTVVVNQRNKARGKRY